MRLLITGVSGLVGWNVARAAIEAGHEVTATYGQHQLPNAVPLDLTNPSTIEALIEQARPEAVIHAAAMSKPDACAQAPDLCHKVNVDGSRLLARAAAAYGARFLFLSSDLVYGAATGLLTEDAVEPQPYGVYATSKLAAERAVLEATNGQAFVARTSLVYGWGAGFSVCFFEEWLATLRAGQVLRAFTDQYRCPTYAGDLANALLAAAQAGLSGIYNIAGPELSSRYDFAQLLAAEFALDPSLIQPIHMADFNYKDPRPLHVQLSNAKLQAAIPYAPVAPRQGLHLLHASERGADQPSGIISQLQA